MEYHAALGKIDEIVERDLGKADKIRSILDLLYGMGGKYHWVGVYVLDPAGETLILHDYYRGRPTEHRVIPVSKGICGAAVRARDTIVVPDVTERSEYLACSLETRSEIVIPIRRDGSIIGELDLDSDHIAAFNDKDKRFLEAVAERLSRLMPL